MGICILWRVSILLGESITNSLAHFKEKALRLERERTLVYYFQEPLSEGTTKIHLILKKTLTVSAPTLTFLICKMMVLDSPNPSQH